MGMHGSKLGHILLLGALTILPGCLAINAALGVFGVIGPPAAQLAGAAYTVAEYSYEYGAHDRTPDEVFLAKFDWLMEDGDEPDPAAFAGALSAAVPGPQIADGPRPTVALADAGEMFSPFARPDAGPHNEPIAAPLVKTSRTVKARLKARPVKKAKRSAPVKRAAKVQRLAPGEPAQDTLPRRPAPVHTYVAHAPDPLLTRLDRIENGLAQAEALYLSETKDGLRLSVPPCDGDPCTQGVNGGHSLRLQVTRNVPANPA
jgi:hypothetical protein